MSDTTQQLTGERADLVETLRKHRGFLLYTVAGLSEEQARLRSTVSILDLAGLIKHVSDVEEAWLRFARGEGHGGPDWEDMADWQPADPADPRHDEFHLLAGETLAGVLAHYEEVAAATDAFVAVADLDSSHPLPPAPWFPPGAAWSARRVLLHVIAETSQHAGHADILREAIDGQKTM